MIGLTMGHLEYSSVRSTVLVTVLCSRGPGFRRHRLFQLGLNLGHMGGRLVEGAGQLTFSLVRSASLAFPKLRCFLPFCDDTALPKLTPTDRLGVRAHGHRGVRPNAGIGGWIQLHRMYNQLCVARQLGRRSFPITSELLSDKTR